jgi:hypothetical protein
MGCLTVFDVSGIQNYLFKSSKLKENLGASQLVTDLLKKMLPYSIATICDGLKLDCKTDWEEAKKFLIAKSDNIAAEIVYIGGGNAMVAFSNKDIAREVTKKLSMEIIKKAPGLEFSAAHLETDFKDFKADRKELLGKKLFIAKNSSIRSSGLLGISITRKCQQTGLPASEPDPDNDDNNKKNKKYISSEIYSKREAAKNDIFVDLIKKKELYQFPLDIEKLGQTPGESHIAVIHIDGNNMGACLNEYLASQDDYQNAVKTMRGFSKQVKENYRAAFKEVVGRLEQNIEEQDGTYYCIEKKDVQGKIVKKKFELNYDSKTHKAYLPIRPILFEGDDITFVTDARLGLSVAEFFLKEISSKVISINDVPRPMSACAGIAIVKTRFPFFRAYRLAEELCGSAKRKAKIIAGQDSIPTGNWLDFHIVQSGITTDLSSIRYQQYNVPGMPAPGALEYDGITHREYNLCWRPWQVNSDDPGNPYEWENFKNMFKELQEKWPKSKLKDDLRRAFTAGKSARDSVLKETGSRGNKLPVFDASGDSTDSIKPFLPGNITPYYDALELLDFMFEF